MSDNAHSSRDFIAARQKRIRRASTTSAPKVNTPARLVTPTKLAPPQPERDLESTPTSTTAPEHATPRAHIVYFVNCMLNKNWPSWVRGQMAMARPLDAVAVHVEATVADEDKLRLSQIVHAAFEGTPTRVHVRTHGTHNQYEYPGIMRAWRLGRKHAHTNDVVVYVHSKGVTHQPTFEKSMAAHICGRVLREHRHIREVLRTREEVNKVALFASDRGFAWYNFWWARASYLARVERPVQTDRRHYYERWLSKHVAPNKSQFTTDLHRDASTYDVSDARDTYDLSLRRVTREGRTGHHAGRVVAKAHARRLARESAKPRPRPAKS